MKFIIFDIDGTLADTKKVEDRCFMKAFEKTFDIDITSEKWEKLKNVTDWGITEEIIERERNRPPREEEYQKMISNFVEELNLEKERDKSQFQEVPGAKDFFYELKEGDDFALGIATGAWEQSAMLKLEAIGINIDGICFSNSNHFKSREAITEDAINQLIKRKTNTKPERIVYFGDGEWDYKTCKKLDIDFIGLDIEKDGKLKSLGAETVFHNYLDKAAIYKELNEAMK